MKLQTLIFRSCVNFGCIEIILFLVHIQEPRFGRPNLVQCLEFGVFLLIHITDKKPYWLILNPSEHSHSGKIQTRDDLLSLIMFQNIKRLEGLT